jgi:hypothetical protein
MQRCLRLFPSTPTKFLQINGFKSSYPSPDNKMPKRCQTFPTKKTADARHIRGKPAKSERRQ